MQTTVAITYKLPFRLAATLMLVVPATLLIFNKVRQSLTRIAAVSALIVLGLIFDRIRFFIAPMANPSPFGHIMEELPAPYWPNALDVLFVIGFIGLMFAVFVYAASRIPVFNGWEMREGSMLRKERTFMKAHVLVIGKPD